METFYILKDEFLNWFFHEGDNDEIEEIRKNIAKKVISDIESSGKCTIDAQYFFDNCNKDLIPVKLLNDKHGCGIGVGDIIAVGVFKIELL